MIRILIIKPSSLGDVIHAAGAVRAIAEAREDAAIVWLANEEYAGFVREFPGVSDVLAFPRQRFRRKRFGRSLPSVIRWLRSIR
ncbi:MAG TPA: lipopolysaccharide heptosyltransferase I, partial [Planctomycetota bacterium]|nr:lipopolysaccharide heptosyltransferase I [Planctomycetota bacterium]